MATRKSTKTVPELEPVLDPEPEIVAVPTPPAVEPEPSVLVPLEQLKQALYPAIALAAIDAPTAAALLEVDVVALVEGFKNWLEANPHLKAIALVK